MGRRYHLTAKKKTDQHKKHFIHTPLNFCTLRNSEHWAGVTECQYRYSGCFVLNKLSRFLWSAPVPNQGARHRGVGMGEDFGGLVDITSKTLSMKGIIDVLDFINIKKFCSVKDSVSRE